jgi:glycosyltransferase involved in cell wall biosynthesis
MFFQSKYDTDVESNHDLPSKYSSFVKQTEDSQIKILIVIDNLTCGGKERRLVSLLQKLVAINYLNIELALIDEDIFYKNGIPAKIKIHSFNRRFKRDPFIFIQIHKLYKNINPDIIHSWGSMPTIYSIPSVRKLNIRLITSEIANATPNSKYFARLRSKISFKYSDLIVSNSLAGIEAYNAPKNKTRCIYNGFNFDRKKCITSKSNIRKKYSVNTKYIVGMVGKVIPKKDYLTYLVSATEIIKQRDDVTFFVVGDGDQLKQYKTLANGNPKIIFTGEITDTESIINAFDVGVLTTNSNIHGEGISNSILEYMAFGKPVIATDYGGNKELIIEGVTGYLINNMDSSSLIKKLNYLLNHEKLQIKMGDAGRKLIMEKFNIDRMVLSTLQLYHDVMGIQKNILKEKMKIPLSNKGKLVKEEIY